MREMIILDPNRTGEFEKGYGLIVRDAFPENKKFSIELEFKAGGNDFTARYFSWAELDIIISSLLKFRLLNSDKAPFMKD